MKSFLYKRVPETMCRKIDRNAADIRWESPGKEFYYEGEMYDVARTIVENGKEIMLCVNDEKEAQLISEFSKQMQTHHENSCKNKKTLKVQVYDSVLYSTENITPQYEYIDQQYYSFTDCLLNYIQDVNAPPPRC